MNDLARTVETVAAAGIAAVLTFAYIVYSGRALGPEGFADVSAALALIYFFGVAVSPVTPTIARIVARLAVRGDTPSIASTRRAIMSRMFVWCGAAAIVGIALSPLIGRALHFRSSVTVALALCCVLAFALLSADRGVLQGLLRFREYNLNSVIEALIRCLGALVLIPLAGRSAVPVMVSYVAALLIAEFLIAARFAHDWRDVARAAVGWKEIGELARPMFVFMIGIAVFQNADMLAVKRWFSPADSGMYGAAAMLARVIGVIFVPLYALAGPLLTAAHESGRRVVGVALQLCAALLALSLVPLVLFMAWSRLIITELYGATFVGGAPVLAPLSGVAIITYTAIMLAQVLITIGDFAFLKACAVVAVAEVVGLVLFHRSFVDILSVLYVSQTAMLLAVLAMLIRVRHA